MRLVLLRLHSSWLVGQVDEAGAALLDAVFSLAPEGLEAAALGEDEAPVLRVARPAELQLLTGVGQGAVGQQQLTTVFHVVLLPVERLAVDLNLVLAAASVPLEAGDGAEVGELAGVYQQALAALEALRTGRRVRVR